MIYEKHEDEACMYVKPRIEIIFVSNDIITESHFDPNMGEWDTDI